MVVMGVRAGGINMEVTVVTAKLLGPSDGVVLTESGRSCISSR